MFHHLFGIDLDGQWDMDHDLWEQYRDYVDVLMGRG